ncbi:MAG: hypothetical protein ABWJ42_03755 [Sulfolobales archaeon]
MSQQSSKSKELKIVARPVVTIDQIKNNQRALRLLHLISLLGRVSERNLLSILKELKDSGLDLGYSIVNVAGSPVSKDFREDITSLLYVGLLEASQQNRVISLTSLGREFLNNNLDNEFLERARAKIEELKPKISMLIAESDVKRR